MRTSRGTWADGEIRGRHQTLPAVGTVTPGRERLPRSAVTPVERVAWARLRLYELYDANTSAAGALDLFRQAWWDPLAVVFRRLDDCLPDQRDAEDQLTQAARSDRILRYRYTPLDIATHTRGKWARRYLHELAGLAEDLGLSRIPMVGTPPIVTPGYLPSGTAQAHRYLWHLDKALLFERDAGAGEGAGLSESPRPTFVRLASFWSPVPKVDLSIAGADARWDPRTEYRSDALRRLRRRKDLQVETIKRELDRISREGAYEFPDTITQRTGVSRADRDAQWVWWRLRFRWPYRRIAEEWENLHPGDILFQERRDRKSDDERADAGAPGRKAVGVQAQQDKETADEVAREPWPMEKPEDAVGLVRKGIGTFAEWARVDVTTGPGRPKGQRTIRRW